MKFSLVDKIRTIVYSTSGILGLGTGLGAALITTNPLIGVATGAGVALVTAVGGSLGPIRAAKTDANQSKLNPDVFGKLPGELKTEFDKLDKLHVAYLRVENPLSAEIESIIVNAQALFERINNKLDTQAGRLAAVNYTDTLKKLNKALGEDYYLDILKNEHLWDRPKERLEAVEKAVSATNSQLIKQIRQVNASEDIDYEVTLETLTHADLSLEDELLGDN